MIYWTQKGSSRTPVSLSAHTFTETSVNRDTGILVTRTTTTNREDMLQPKNWFGTWAFIKRVIKKNS